MEVSSDLTRGSLKVPQLKARRTWHVGPAWRLNIEVKRPVDLPSRRKEKLVALECTPSSLRCFLQESETRSPKGWQLCVGILDCSWHSGEGQHRSQSTGTVSCLHGQPPKRFLLNTALISNAAGSGCTAFSPLQNDEGKEQRGERRLWKRRIQSFAMYWVFRCAWWMLKPGTSKRFRRSVKISNLPSTEHGFSGSWECSQGAQSLFSFLLSCRYLGKSIHRKCAMLLLLLHVFHKERIKFSHPIIYYKMLRIGLEWHSGSIPALH